MRKILLGIFSAMALVPLFLGNMSLAAIPPDLPRSYMVIGDINGSGTSTGLDVVYAVRYFKGGAAPVHYANCTGLMNFPMEGDVNGSCSFTGLDITYLVRFFKGGPALMPCNKCLRDSVLVTDANILPGQNVTWHSDTTYILTGFVFVDAGAVLTIEPGTVIKGHPGQAENASALVVARDGKIIADGTSDAPIIMTASSDWTDNLNALPIDLRGAWGSLILLGRASTSNATERHIEGIPETEPRGFYGGANDEDSSGVIRYVSLRHGGSIIGANNEINGLTLAGIGSRTLIDYVEVFANLDDGVEYFGGNAYTRHILTVFCDDDNIDYDEGYHGKIQYFCALQNPNLLHGNRGGEWDGGLNPEDALPYSNPYLANVTFIGSGAAAVNTDNDWGIMLRDYAMGKVYNSIFTEYTKRGLSVGDGTSGPGTLANLYSDSFHVQNTLWYNFGLAPTHAAIDIWRPDSTANYLTAHPEFNNQIMTTPILNSLSWTNDHNLDPRTVSSIAAPSVAFPGIPWFEPATYYGAFDPNPAVPLWTDGWTFLSKLGFTAH